MYSILIVFKYIYFVVTVIYNGSSKVLAFQELPNNSPLLSVCTIFRDHLNTLNYPVTCLQTEPRDGLAGDECDATQTCRPSPPGPSVPVAAALAEAGARPGGG